jgi:hypothetical protein
MAAGLGFKTFITGEVLTAGDVNGYLMQGVLVFASEAARNAAITSPEEGQFAYTKDNNSLWYYTGSAWAASGATGDIEGVTAGTGLTGGGTSGTVTLAFDVANYGGGSYAAGKNAVINGAFNVWQRGTTVTPASGTFGYGADRWRTYSFAATSSTQSQQTFTPGTAPVAGYEGTYFARFASTNTATYASQPIEDVRTFAGQTATISFWAKSASAQTLSSVKVDQVFGAGGSSTVTTNATPPAITTSWARYSMTISIPSISGKTIGANNYVDLVISGGINNNLDLWGVQVEEGSTATDFQTASGTIAGELALCQRYYYRITGTNTFSNICPAYSDASNNAVTQLTVPVELRVAPTSVDFSNIRVTNFSFGAAVTSASVSSVFNGKNNVAINLGVAGTPLTGASPFNISCNNNAAGYLGVSAEL